MDENISQVINTLHRLTSGIFSDAIQRKLILDNLTSGVFTVDPDLKVTSFNKAAETITGISETEAIGKICTELFTTPTKDEFCLVAQVMITARPQERLMRHITVQGVMVPVLASASPLIDKSGMVVGAMQSFQEITDIFHRQLILDSIFDGVFTVDLDYKITLFNKAAEQLTGYRQEEVLGKHFAKALRLQKKVYDSETALAQAIESGKPATEECVYMETKTGLILPVSVSAAPLLDARGQIFGGVESFRDNTDRLQTNLILDHVVDGVFTVDTQGKITSFNHAAARITGYAQDDALGSSCHDLLSSSDCEVREGELQSPLNTPEQWVDKNLYLKVKDDRIVPVSMSSVPITDNDQRVLGMVQTFRDITNQLEKQYILDSVADGVFTVDRNFIITSFNRAAEKITGYTSQEVIGSKCRDIFHASVCATRCPLSKAIRDRSRVDAYDILIKGKDGQEIPVSVSSTALMDEDGNIIGGVETFKDLSEVTKLRKQLSEESEKTGIISSSPRMKNILSVLPAFAQSESTILILGESGTGKELIAQAIHQLSTRKDKPFVTVNSGALPDTLLESELFGYKAGAFTDARKDRKGRFAVAEGGTLFLDEIGDISPAMQVKLLRVLQARVYEPLGSNVPVNADVRIITATNKNLEEMVANNQFREDLYYRLNVVGIELPPLRDRMEDLPLLIDHFIDKFNRQRKKNVQGISKEALDILMHYEYPGNIRELENIIEHTFILCRETLILPQHLPEIFHAGDTKKPQIGIMSLADIEKQAILEALKRNKNKKMKTCRELGISKDTLRRKLKAYGSEADLGNV